MTQIRTISVFGVVITVMAYFIDGKNAGIEVCVSKLNVDHAEC